MAGRDERSEWAAGLRRRAEEAARVQAAVSQAQPEMAMSAEAQDMLHELQVHQIELEMQNEELRRAQIELDEARTRYFDLYHMAPVGYLTLSDQGLIREANLSAASRLGMPRVALVQQPLTRFILKEAQDGFYLFRRQARESVMPVGLDLHMVQQDGTPFWAHLDMSTATEADGSPVLRVVLSDIDHRKLTEDLLELKVHQRTAALDHANRLLRVISSCNEMLVRASDEAELVREICRIAVETGGYQMACVRYVEEEESRISRSGDASYLLSRSREPASGPPAPTGPRPGRPGRCIRTGEICPGGDACMEPAVDLLRRQAAEKGTRASIGLPLMLAGKVGAVLEIFSQDVDEFQDVETEMLHKLANDLAFGIVAIRSREERDRVRRQLEHRTEQLRALSAEMVQAEQRERYRLAKVLHDNLQQILVAAKWRMGALGSNLEDRGMIDACSQVEMLLDQAIRSSRNLASELNPVMLLEKGLVPALEWLARQMQERHGLTVEVHADHAADLLNIQAKQLLFETVRELLFNVIKHAGIKHARIRTSQVDGRFQIVVEDDGLGFNPDLAHTGHGGTGLGLSGIGERLEHIGGWMLLNSSPGQGSQVHLIIPLETGAPEEIQPRFPFLPESGGQDSLKGRSLQPLPRKVRLLLADDHPLVRQGLARLLETQADIEIVGEADDGLEAVELAREVHPDIVLMDLNMPHMSGIAATKLIHEELPAINIIGLSVHNSDKLTAEFLGAGAVAFVCKSEPLEFLVATIYACHLGERQGEIR